MCRHFVIEIFDYPNERGTLDRKIASFSLTQNDKLTLVAKRFVKKWNVWLPLRLFSFKLKSRFHKSYEIYNYNKEAR